jgi:hypothetical protein
MHKQQQWDSEKLKEETSIFQTKEQSKTPDKGSFSTWNDWTLNGYKQIKYKHNFLAKVSMIINFLM